LHYLRNAFVCGLLSLASACSTTGTTGGGAAVETPRPDYERGAPAAPPAVTPAPAPRPPAAGSSPYSDLVKRAISAREQGDYNEALALLERAQRIDPDNADLYLQMAITHSQRGDAAQSRATAERGMLYCHGASQCDALKAYIR
jgi:tetratricopeptide (TPR) repeat protein